MEGGSSKNEQQAGIKKRRKNTKGKQYLDSFKEICK